MAFLPTYSARNVLVNYAGAILDGGRPEDTFVTITENAPRASFRKGNSGDTSAALSADHSVTVVLTFFTESQAAKILSGIYSGLKSAEKAGSPVLGSYPMVISDPSGSTLLVAKDTVLMNKTEVGLGADSGTVSFEFFVDDATQLPLPDDLAASAKDALSKLGVEV